MKITRTIAILIIGFMTLSGCEESTILDDNDSITSFTNLEENVSTKENSDLDNPYGSTGALEDDSFTIEEMLLYAIQDEYAARQEYEYILNTFDVTTPFSNIIKSEETHISLLIPLFETYGYQLPIDTSLDHLVTISSLEETFKIGVYAEIMNIDMYNLFLEQDDLPDDIRDVFIKLRDASINHLDAFEKNAEKYS